MHAAFYSECAAQKAKAYKSTMFENLVSQTYGFRFTSSGTFSSLIFLGNP
jgi:hypothetical protein